MALGDLSRPNMAICTGALAALFDHQSPHPSIMDDSRLVPECVVGDMIYLMAPTCLSYSCPLSQQGCNAHPIPKKGLMALQRSA